MAITEFDLGKIDELIATEEATLEPKHAESIAYRAVADRHVAGGVASSWQDSPPHAIFVDHGLGSRLWDIDGNEYLDFHLGYGAMVVGHAHPKIVEAMQKQAARGTHFAQPTKDLDVIGENLADRFKLPLWRFANSGTETTLEAIRLMRANTGRDMIIKIEGTYHGHHDSIMFSVGPERSEIGPREHPVTVHQAMGIPQAFADLVRVVPYNDLTEAKRAFDENPGKIAGLIIEPAMMNCGVILPEPGYLQGLKDLCHANGAYLAFDEVKTGATLAYGGATEVFGVVPDVICLAKAIGGGTPCGAIGATEELYGPVLRNEYDMAGTFNGNPLTMAASRAALDRGAGARGLRAVQPDRQGDAGRPVLGRRVLRSAVSRHRRRREGLGDLLDAAGARVPRRGRHRRADHLPRLADAAEPRRVQVALDQAGDLDPVGRPHRGGRAVATSRTSRSSPRR